MNGVLRRDREENREKREGPAGAPGTQRKAAWAISGTSGLWSGEAVNPLKFVVVWCHW